MKPTVTEADLRDHLASNLSLIEPGLELVAKEYPVPNPYGAAGRIDLLTRDRFGNFVVVELKRSDAAARSALNELLKYLALLQSTKGLLAGKLRCILLSTDWHELLAPFSELLHTSPFSLEGRRLLLKEGAPCGTEAVKPLQAGGGLRFPESFSWLTFATIDARHDVARELQTLLPKIGLANVVLVELSAVEGRDLPFEFSLIMPIFPMTRDEALAVLEQKHFPIELLSDFGPVDLTPEGDLAALREAVQSSLESKIFCLPGVGDPHPSLQSNFAAERDLWRVDSIFRFGPAVSDRLVLSDDDILAGLAGAEGSNDVQFVRAVDPTHKAQFAEFASYLERYLSRYGWWEAVEPVLHRAAETRGATIVAHAYCPDAFLQHLALFLRSHDETWLPAFEVLVSTPDYCTQLRGFFAWDGATPPPPVDEVLSDRGVGGNVLRLVVSESKHQRALAKGYGFVFPVLSTSSPGAPRSSCRWLPITEWLQQHAESAAELSTRLGPIIQF